MTKKLLTLLTVLALMLTCLSVAWAEEAAPEESLTETSTLWDGITYTVDGDLTIPERISIMDGKQAVLILNGTLTASQGIYVPENAGLTIQGTGTLIATGSAGNAGIGGNRDVEGGVIRIYGGNIEATGGIGAAGIGGGTGENSGSGAIIIADGTVRATGDQFGAGIGSGTDNKSRITITIRGGNVTANGGEGGAGIGAAVITITNGTVNATGNSGGAGIGSRSGVHFTGTVDISGGSVTAKGAGGGAGIGAGQYGSYKEAGLVTISGGTVRASGSIGSFFNSSGVKEYHCSAGIGCSVSGAGMESSSFEGAVNINGGTVYAYGGGYGSSRYSNGGAGIGAGYGCDATNGQLNISGGTVYAYGGHDAAGIGGSNGCNKVKILGGTVIAQSGSSGSAIGSAVNGGSKGNVSFADGMMVQAGNDGTNYEHTFASDQRSAACQDNSSARIEACDHTGNTYEYVDKLNHRRTCDYCLTAFSETPHELDDAGHCAICDTTLTDVTLTFMVNGTAAETRKVRPYSTEIMPEADETQAPDGQMFYGWEADGQTYREGSEFDVGVADVTFTASWSDRCLITFEGNMGNIQPEDDTEVYPTVTMEAAKGSLFTIPDFVLTWPDESEDKTFQGWQIGNNPNLRLPDYSFPVEGDMTLKAIWDPQFTVVFDSQGGSEVELQIVPYGGTATEPDYPHRDSLVFRGWQLDGEPYDFDTPVTEDITLKAVWEGGGVLNESCIVWGGFTYIVEGDLTIPDRITVKSQRRATLVLNGTLTLPEGICVPDNTDLVIKGSGKLIANSSGGNAAIGANKDATGGDIIIEGGTVEAKGADGSSGIGDGCGSSRGTKVTINGGTVRATGHSGGAGIGQSTDAVYNTNTVTINGGTVIANGGEGGPGINADIVTITSGTVTANGHGGGAGIGTPGQYGNFISSVIIQGGTVNARGSGGGAGIGAGKEKFFMSKGSVTISGGTVRAWGSAADIDYRGSAGIGSSIAHDDYICPMEGTITISGGEVYAYGGGYGLSNNGKGGAGIGAGYGNSAADGHIILSGGTIHAYGGSDAAGIGAGSHHKFDNKGCNDVQISDDVLVIAQSSGTGSAIGCGAGCSDVGHITFSDNLKVYAGNDGTNYEREGMPFTEGEREDACQWRYNARIEPCDHPGMVYTCIDDEKHLQSCEYCKTTFEEEPHQLDENSECLMCDFRLPDVNLTFMANGTQQTKMAVRPNTVQQLPEGDNTYAPEGKLFYGWEVNGETLPAEADFEVGYEDMTFTAVWTDKCVITFDGNRARIWDSDFGEWATTITLPAAKGSLVTIPDYKLSMADQSANGFEGWQIGDDRNLRMPDYTFVVTGDMEIRAIWGIYTVSFDTDGGSEVPEQEVFYYDPIVKPEDPTMEGYRFNGWQLDGEVYNIDTPVTESIMLVASWAKFYGIELPKGLKASVNGTAVTDAAEGDTVTLTVDTDKGYELNGSMTVKCGEDNVDLTSAGENTFTFTMPAGDVIVTADITRSAWLDLKDMMTESGTITLEQDIVAGQNEGALIVPAGATVTLELNGHTLSRDRKAKAADGYVIRVEGTLNVEDTTGDGVITGGWNNGNGGGVYIANGGNFNMHGGSIRGNIADAGMGGGVYVQNGGRFLMRSGSIAGGRNGESNALRGGGVYVDGWFYMGGGAITGNKAGYGGAVQIGSGEFTMKGGTISDNEATYTSGVLVEANGTFTMRDGSISGNRSNYNGAVYMVEGGIFWAYDTPVISDNTTDGSIDNVHLNRYAFINVPGDGLSPSALIGVTMEEPGVFVKNFISLATAARFTSDNAEYAVGVNAASEAFLGAPVTVTFDSDGGSEVDAQIIAKGSKVMRPEDPIKEQSAIKYWYKVTEDAGAADVPFDFASIIKTDITLKAVWEKSPWKYLQNRINRASDGETIALTEEVTAMPEDVALVIPEDKNITLDLAGHTINRNMTAAASDGCVILVRGSLTVTDSSEDKKGTITGGWNNGNGGGVFVYINGALTLEGGSITGNKAGNDSSPDNGGGVFVFLRGTFTMTGGAISNNTCAGSGGGVHVYNRGVFTMTGGEISGNNASIDGGGVGFSGTFTLSGGVIRENNSATVGGGVHVLNSSSTFNLSGDPVIADNTSKYGNDVCMAEDAAPINITGPLTNATPIAVDRCSEQASAQPFLPGVITSGLKGNGTAANFASGSGDYLVGINEDGEAYLYSLVTVTFDSDGGTAVDAQIIESGSKAMKPEDPTRENFAFEGWYQILDENEGTLAENAFDFENTEVSESITLKAVWREDPDFGEPDFTLPGAIKAIDENAFEGAAMHIVYIPDGCASIGAEAFKDCGNLTQIRVPANCEISDSAFDGCGKVYIFGTAGSPAEAYCAEHTNCVFIEE